MTYAQRLLAWGACWLALTAGTTGAMRVATYNIYNGGIRTGLYDIIQHIGTTPRNGVARPVDILLLQEMTSSSTVTQICNQMNLLYAADPAVHYISGGLTSGSDAGLIYNDQAVEYLDGFSLVTDGPRNTARYHFRPVGYYAPEAEFYIYNAHLKAGTSSSDENTRAAEAADIRADADALGPNVNIIYAGDMNFYGNYSPPSYTEPGWGAFTAAGNGQAWDPLNRVGNWHNYIIYMDIHTQNPGFNFTGGGMDDRFDFQLVTAALNDGEGLSYIGPNAGDSVATEQSYHALGNNGTHDWNSANGTITTGTGAPAQILQYLTTVSDHLPVVADYQVPARMAVAVDDALPAPRVLVQHAAYMIPVWVTNTAAVTHVVEADELDYEISVLGGCGLAGFGALPDGWQHGDIGAVTLAGDAAYDAGTDTFRVRGAGEYGGTADTCHFAYQDLLGDGVLDTRLAAVSLPSAAAKGGLMIRAGLDAGAPFAAISVTAAGQVLWQHRVVPDGATTTVAGRSGAALPVWLKLTRAGQILAGYESPDGQNWTLVYQQDIPSYFLGDAAVAGYAVASGGAAGLCTADFGGDAGGGGPATVCWSGQDAPLGGADQGQATLDTSQAGEWGTVIRVTATSTAAEGGPVEQALCYRVTPYQDFDSDGDFDADDADLMLAALGGTDPLYDLDGDGGVIDDDDLDVLVGTVLGTCYGDWNLDRQVDQVDLQQMASHWLTTGVGWSEGDGDGDGRVGVNDFALMSMYWMCPDP